MAVSFTAIHNFLAMVSVGDDTSLSSFSLSGASAVASGPGKPLRRLGGEGCRRRAVASGVRKTCRRKVRGER